MRPDHHVVVVVGLDELVDRGVQCPGEVGQLVEADPPVPGLDPAQRRRAEEAASGQVVERPAPGHPQPSDPLADQGVDVAFLRHAQESMSAAQGVPRLDDMSHHAHDHHDPSDLQAHDGADMLDLDAEVVAEQLDEVRADLARLADSPVRRILDLGAGTGTGTFGLLGHFPEAQVIAVDASEEMLDRIRRRAAHLGLADRVTTVCADLDHAVPQLEPVDLAWASASLHHLADPDRTLAEVVPTIRPGGLLAVVELAGFPRFLPDDTEAGAAEAGAHALLAADRAADMPTMGSDWAPRLVRSGLTLELDRPITVDLAPPLPPAVGQYAAVVLARLRDAVADRLAPDQLAALDELLADDAHALRHRRDLHVRTERRLWVGRRPTA